jgi:hygromycin-B 7''-O-kinase
MRQSFFMRSTNSNFTFPIIHSFEEYENLKLKPEIFENAAKKIIHRHQLPDEPLLPFEGTNIVFSYGKNRVIKIFLRCTEINLSVKHWS